MRRLFMALLALATVPVGDLAAQGELRRDAPAAPPPASTLSNLQGRYQLLREGYNGTYFGIMVISPSGEVRLKGTSPTQNYSECGYVQVKGGKIDVIFTTARGDRSYTADHFYCQAAAGGTLTCLNVDAAGQTSGKNFTLTRTGGLPATEAERLEDICPPGQIPRS